MSDQPDVRPEDALQVAQRALAKANELERDLRDLEDEHDETAEELAALQLRYSEVEEDRDYDPADQEGNVGRVREHAFRKAADGHGRASLDYDDVMWGVFDGQPSADYCYKLMRLAANAPGFEFRENRRPKILAVNAQEARTGAAFSSAKKNGFDEVA